MTPEKETIIKSGINYCLDKSVPTKYIEMFSLGQLVKIAYQPNNEAGYGNPIFIYSDESIPKKYTHLAKQYSEDFYESGFKYLDFKKEDLEKIGFRFVGVKTYHGTYPDGSPYSSSFDAWVSKDNKTVITFAEGRTGDGGYSSLYSNGFKLGLERTQKLLSIANYVKEVDWFENGYGSVDEDEASEILQEAKDSKSVLKVVKDKPEFTDEEVAKKLKRIDELTKELQQLKSEVKGESMAEGGHIDFTPKNRRKVYRHFNNLKQKSKEISAKILQDGGSLDTPEYNRLIDEIVEIEELIELNSGGIAGFGKEPNYKANFKKGSVVARPSYFVMKRETPSSSYEFVTTQPLTESEADKMVEEVRRRNPDYYVVEKHFDIGLARGGDLQGLDIANSDLFKEGGELALDEGEYIKLFKDANNNLIIRLTDEGREWVEEEGMITEDNFDELFEDIHVNSDFTYGRNLGDFGLGMSEAPFISQGYYYNDEGEFVSEEDSNLWYYNEYMLKDPMEILSTEGQVVFLFANFKEYGGQLNEYDFQNLNIANADLIKKGGSIKTSDIQVGDTFLLPNGEEIKINRLFVENGNEDWVETERSKGTHQQGRMETSLKQLKLFLNRWGAKKMKKGGETDQWAQEAEEEMKKKGTIGKFTKKAKKSGMTTVEYAKKVLANPDSYSEKTRKQAQFMKNLNPELFEDGGQVSSGNFALVNMTRKREGQDQIFIVKENLTKEKAKKLMFRLKKFIYNGWEIIPQNELSKYSKIKGFDPSKPLTPEEEKILKGNASQYAKKIYDKPNEQWGDAMSRARIKIKGIKIRKLLNP